MSSELVKLKCGCLVEKSCGDNCFRLERACLTHSNMDIVQQVHLLREAEQLAVFNPATLKVVHAKQTEQTAAEC